MKQEQKITKLENGLLVLTDSMDTVDTVAISIMVNVGSRYENIKNNGISHFLEHMAFKGTKTRTALQIAESFDNIGGILNAYTSKERTNYYCKILKEDTEISMEILADILQNSIFSQEEIEKERTVIIQEIAASLDTPDDIIFDYFSETCFPNQAIGRPIAGTSENVMNITRDNIVSFVDEHYNTENMILSVAGNCDHEHIVSLAAKYLGSLKHTKRDLILEKGVYQGGDFRKEKDLEQVNFLLGFAGPSIIDESYYTAQILSSILGDGMSSRLFQEVREKRGLAYSVYSFLNSYKDTGVFTVHTGTDDSKINEATKVICSELLRVTEDLNEAELTKSIKGIKASLVMSMENPSNRANRMANHYFNFGRYISNDEIISKIENITLDDIKKIGKEIFAGKPTIAALGKISKLNGYDTIANMLKN